MSRASAPKSSGPGADIQWISDVPGEPFVDGWFEVGSAEHFWFRWRFRALQGLIRSLGLPTDQPLRVLDIGGGHGVLRSQIESATAWQVDVVDLDRSALARCAPGRGRILFYDILEQRSEFLGNYDVLLMMDVLEHIETTRPFLEASTAHLRPGGTLLLNVPALRACMSIYDRAAGHFRRYQKDTLREEFNTAEFELLEQRYWGVSLVPAVLARKAILDFRDREADAIEEGFPEPHWIADRALRALLHCETALLKRPPVGASLLAGVRYDPS
jgi:SAM-dependent methyltransferase